jgi:hypothetical protein
MRPDTSGGDLLYVSDPEAAAVYVFSYPSGSLAGTLRGFTQPEGLCSDQVGNVFVADQRAADIVEYAHGGKTPIAVLADPAMPNACSVDVTTKNLAVSNFDDSVGIYQREQGKATLYATDFETRFCAFDTAGNLFADGLVNGAIALVELPKARSAFVNVTYRPRIKRNPAGLQWVGSHLAVGRASPYRSCCGSIMRFTVGGAVAKQTGNTLLRGATNDFFIAGSTAIVSTGTNNVALYAYPRGGDPIQNVGTPGYTSAGVTLSAGAENRRKGQPSRAPPYNL